MSSGPILIVAGNAAQAGRWASDFRLPRLAWRYVGRPEHLLGLRGARVVKVGEYWKAPHDVTRELAYRIAVGDVVLVTPSELGQSPGN